MATQGTVEVGEMSQAERERRRKAIAFAKASGAEHREVAKWFGVSVVAVRKACQEFREDCEAIERAIAKRK